MKWVLSIISRIDFIKKMSHRHCYFVAAIFRIKVLIELFAQRSFVGYKVPGDFTYASSATAYISALVVQIVFGIVFFALGAKKRKE